MARQKGLLWWEGDQWEIWEAIMSWNIYPLTCHCLLLVCYAANTGQTTFMVTSTRNPTLLSLVCSPLGKHMLLKRVGHQVQVSQVLWFFPWKSISHLVFWYTNTLGLPLPQPHSFQSGRPTQSLVFRYVADSTSEWTLGYHPSRWWYHGVVAMVPSPGRVITKSPFSGWVTYMYIAEHQRLSGSPTWKLWA